MPYSKDVFDDFIAKYTSGGLIDNLAEHNKTEILVYFYTHEIAFEIEEDDKLFFETLESSLKVITFPESEQYNSEEYPPRDISYVPYDQIKDFYFCIRVKIPKEEEIEEIEEIKEDSE